MRVITLRMFTVKTPFYSVRKQSLEPLVLKKKGAMTKLEIDIHTSGHADRHTIEKVIKTVQPKEVICIHKEADAIL